MTRALITTVLQEFRRVRGRKRSARDPGFVTTFKFAKTMIVYLISWYAPNHAINLRVLFYCGRTALAALNTNSDYAA